METVLSSEIVFRCPVFSVERATVRTANGRTEERWYAVKNDAVGIVPVDEKGLLLLTREFRSASQDTVWRIPAGGLKDGEAPEQGARRELREELGFDAEKLEPLLVKKSPSGWIKQRTHFFLAEQLFSAPLDSGEQEQIEIVPTSVTEALARAERGEFSPSIAEAIREAVRALRQRDVG